MMKHRSKQIIKEGCAMGKLLEINDVLTHGKKARHEDVKQLLDQITTQQTMQENHR